MAESPGRELGVAGLTWLAELGSGGFGSVHRARDEDHGRDVAIKLLHASIDDRSRARFDRERRLMGSVSGHPNIVTIHTSGFTEMGVPYIVMELIEGGTLGDALATGPLHWSRTVELGVMLGRALQAAHHAGVLHLDIKPDNVMLGATGEPLLADFGIASSMSEIALRNTISISPFYSPPEVLNNVGVDARADVYSLACTLYTCLTGERPYDRGGVMGSISAMASEPTPRVTSTHVPPALTQLLAEAMEKTPDARPVSMQAFTDRLAALHAQSASQPAAASGATSATTVAVGRLDAQPTPESSFVDVAASPGLVPAAASSPWRIPVIVGAAAVLALVGLLSFLAFGSRDDDGAQVAIDPDATIEASAVESDAPQPETPTTPPTQVPEQPTVTPIPAEVAAQPPPTRPPASSTRVPLGAVVPREVSSIAWSRGLDAQDQPVGVFPGTIPPGTTHACISFTLARPVTGKLEFVFRVPGFEPDYNRTFTVDAESFGDRWWGCYEASEVCGTCTIPLGLLDFQFFDDGNFVFGTGRHVGNIDFHTARIVNNAEVPLCALFYADAASLRYWPNEIAQPLPPGAFYDLVLPASSYNILVLDCDREVVTEERLNLSASLDLNVG